jgi:hypothetical protein
MSLSTSGAGAKPLSESFPEDVVGSWDRRDRFEHEERAVAARDPGIGGDAPSC